MTGYLFYLPRWRVTSRSRRGVVWTNLHSNLGGFQSDWDKHRLVHAAPRGRWASAEPHTLHQEKKKKKENLPLIPILYDLNGCRISFFSVSSANGAWWIAFHVRWQHSPLNRSDLVCFVSHTYSPRRCRGTSWRLNYSGPPCSFVSAPLR